MFCVKASFAWRKLAAFVMFGFAFASLSFSTVSAQTLRDRINANTVTVLSGNANGTYLYIAQDISFVLDDGDDMRVLPVVGKGGAQNLRDLLYLRGIDMAIIASDALRGYEAAREFGNIKGQIRYITKLYNEEMHILTSRDITSIEQLDGKTVNFSDPGSGTEFTTQSVFDSLGIKVNKVNLPQRDGFEKLKSGEIDATVLVAGKPSGSWRSLKIDLAKFHVLGMPWASELRDSYFPAKIGHDDYPDLFAEGESVDTIAKGAVLAVYAWDPGTDRYERAKRFVDRFFANIDKFYGPARHPKWRETTLNAELPGWTRFEPAQAWLDTHKTTDVGQLREQFQAFLNLQAGNSNLTQEQQEAMFKLFLDWQKGKQQTN